MKSPARSRFSASKGQQLGPDHFDLGIYSKKFVANLHNYDPQSNPTTAEWHVSWLLIGSLSEWQLQSERVTVQVLAPNLILAGGAVMSWPYGSGAVQVRLAAVDQGIL